jgi:hypothetical protein
MRNICTVTREETMAAFAAGASETLVKSRLRNRDRQAALNAARETRREVAHDGFGILEDGTSFRLSLVDLSYDGCKIATDLALFPGVEFQLVLHGFEGTADAHVIWHKDGHAGISFSSSDERKKRKRTRACERIAVDAQVLLRRRGRTAYEGRLFDLTAQGCKVECVERPRAGELVWVKFGDLDAVEAHVRWVDGFEAGLEFVRPFHVAMFEFVLAKLNG